METKTLIQIILLLSAGRVLAVFSLEAFCKTSWAKAWQIYPVRPIPHRRLEVLMYITGVMIEAGLLILTLQYSVITFHSPSLWGIPVLILSFALIVEPIYYGYHRLLHTKWLYKHYHIHHHRTTVPKPLSGFYFTLTERLSYTALFVLPIYILSSFQLLSIPLLFFYVIGFDIINALGHTNVKIFSDKYEQSITHLFFYSPRFHGDHHKYFRTNYSLFMPIWDKLFKTYRS